MEGGGSGKKIMGCRQLHYRSNFFFQAEDGIRDLTVTGVQTCALPISPVRRGPQSAGGERRPRTFPRGLPLRAYPGVASRDHVHVGLLWISLRGAPPRDRKSVV